MTGPHISSELWRARIFKFLAIGSIAVAAFLSASGANAQGDRGAAPGDFDYYLLVLSWSPTYCDTEGRGEYDQQCSGIRPYSFVLHGLWPQYEARGWPEMCKTPERPWVPQDIVDRMLDIMPSPRLVIQEYRKHGTCSGLDPAGYFDASRRLYNSIHIPERFKNLTQPLMLPPDEVQREFLSANPQLTPEMVEVGCARDKLRDVRICFSKNFKPRKCGESELGRRLCYADTVTLPPVRGARSGAETGGDGGRKPSGI